MIADLKPYAEYKDSGLSWLGQVPAHWRTVRNGSLFGQRSQTGYAELPILEVSLKTGVQVRSFGQAGRKQIMSDLGKYKRAVKGDLAYNTMRMWQGALGVCPVDGLVSPAYVVARPYPEVDAGYFAALFRTGDYMAEIDSASRGIVKDRNRLYWDQFKQMQSPCPPPAEQAAIVRFLDWAGSRLERTIRAKRKVIALLTEQRHAITHRAVTHGLNHDTPLTSTGLLSFGAVPSHWEVRRIRQILEQVNKRNRPDLPLLSVVRERGVITRNTADLDENHNFIPDDLTNYKVVRAGQFAMNKMKAWQGSYGVSQYDGIVSPAYFVFNVHGVTGDFLHTALRSKAYVPFFLQASDGVRIGQWDLAEPRMREIPFFVPPVAEQIAIVTHIRDASSELGFAVARLEREIELLCEYRARLIADVVTGKLNVREAATRLPEEAKLEAGDAQVDEGDEAELTDEEAEA